MIKVLKLELFLILVCVGSCLHLATNSSEPTYNADNYLEQLDARQQRLKSDMANIRKQIQELNVIINSTSITDDQKLTELNEGIADQRDALYNIETYLYPPFEIEPCKAVNLTDAQRERLQQQINKVNKSLNNMSSSIEECQDCPQIDEIKAQIRKQYNYLAVIQATVHSDCLPQPFSFEEENATGLVNLADTLYKDNLKAKNWKWGNTTQLEYKKKLFTQTTQYNLTSCPLRYPFVDKSQRRCVACSGIYNIGERKCQPCENGQTYNSTLAQCVGLTCEEGYKVDTNLNRCVSICKDNESYNFTTKQCDKNEKNCTAGYFYNTTTKECELIVCPPGQLYDPLTNGCLDSNNNTVSICPPNRPYWNQTSIRCEVCPPEAPLYNKLFNRCEKCPQNQFYNSTAGKCQIQCKQGQHWNQTSNSCEGDIIECPGGDSFYHPQQKICVRCPNGTHPDLSTYTCHACPNGSQYNYETKLCDLVACGEGKYYSTSSKKCLDIPTCPSGQFFSTSAEKCVSDPICNQNQILNPSTHRCEPLPACPPGQSYNKQTSSCQPVDYITSPKANNLIYAYPISQYQKQYNEAKSKNPKLQDCPASSPYYDRKERVCVMCDGQHPYFNLHTNLCQNCGGSQYDAQNRRCGNEDISLDPTLERLIMNII